jgi:hypothetical protein
MVNVVKYCWCTRIVRNQAAVLLLGLVILAAAAWLRGAEYDEQYTLFLTAGTPRPDWPDGVFPAGMVAAAQAGHAGPVGIARDLRSTDVHPPLYFWLVAAWRAVLGPGLFTARMLSVLFGVISLAVVGRIARRCGAAPIAAMLVTLGCYGFVYTNAIARGFAPAETFGLAGVALLLGRRPLLAGAMFGAACGCNYLAVFVAAAVIVSARAWRAAAAMAPFLALDAWFFAAQHGSRAGQFPPFALGRSLMRLAEYQVAAVFGGLPLYVDGAVRSVVAAGIGAMAVAVVLAVALTRPWTSDMRVVLAAALAPPAGLLVLGAVFNNTPIELRYLSFGLPFVAILASRLWPHPAGVPVLAASRVAGPSSTAAARVLLPLFVALQIAGIGGLLFFPRTNQPARAAAADAAGLAGNGVVLLPRGNDGVGIVGAFGIEAPPALPLLLVGPGDPVAARVAPWQRVVFAALGQDRDSLATVPAVRAALAAENWRLVANGSNVEVYERR